MQLLIRHQIPDKLILPLNYHHIIQSIIYKNLEYSQEYSQFLHDIGYPGLHRNYKLFTFGLLHGRYEIHKDQICFRNEVKYKIHSPDIYMLRMLTENIKENGLDYGNQHFEDVELILSENTVEEDNIVVKMESPISVYSTDRETGKTRFFSPEDVEFGKRINDNFKRKYQACYGIIPDEDIVITPLKVSPRDKFVTKYKNFYISGWFGVYRLQGKRKYLDFLYQTGLGSKNSQGFGMFEILE